MSSHFIIMPLFMMFSPTFYRILLYTSPAVHYNVNIYSIKGFHNLV